MILAADGEKLAGKPEEAATGLIKGRAGTDVTPHRPPRQARAAQARRARPRSRSPSCRRGRDEEGQEVRRRPPRGLLQRRARRALQGAAQGVGAARSTASSSTCAPTRAGSSTRRGSWPAPSSPEGEIVDDARARGRRAGLPRDRRPRDAEDAARRPRRPRERIGVGDRRRRAAGPRPREARRHAHVRQGRLPGGRRARQRRRASTSPSASTSCPAGATSAARARRAARA